VVSTIQDGSTAGVDIDTQASTSDLYANWLPFQDPESGIASYQWAIGTTSGGTDVQAFTGTTLGLDPISGRFFAYRGSLSLTPGVTYFVTVIGTNGSALSSRASSDGVIIAVPTTGPDTTLPQGSVVNDGPTPGVDIDLQSSTTEIRANWTPFQDPQSGIRLYDWAIGTTPGGQEVQIYRTTDIFSGDVTMTAVRGGLPLTHGTTYYVTVRATNGAGLQTGIVSDGVTLDATPPTGSVVFDGNADGWDWAEQPYATELWANWLPFTDPESGVQAYELAIGTTPGGQEVLAFSNAFQLDGPLPPNYLYYRAYIKGLSLTLGSTYYVSVRATNGVGLTTPVSSNGVTIMRPPM
jgi:hypothetical protein